MKNRKFLTLAVCLMLVLSIVLSACSLLPQEEKKPDPTETPTSNPTPQVTENQEPENTEPALYAEFIADRYLNQLGEYAFYDDAEGSEFATKLGLMAQENLTDVRFLEISGDEVKVLYTVDELAADKAFIINMVFEGYEPNRAIAYTDSKGNTRIFAIAESGEDFVPVLIYMSDVTIVK